MDLFDWAKAEKLGSGFSEMDEFDKSFRVDEIRKQLRLRAMSTFSVSGRTATEYADVVIERMLFSDGKGKTSG